MLSKQGMVSRMSLDGHYKHAGVLLVESESVLFTSEMDAYGSGTILPNCDPKNFKKYYKKIIGLQLENIGGISCRGFLLPHVDTHAKFRSYNMNICIDCNNILTAIPTVEKIINKSLPFCRDCFIHCMQQSFQQLSHR